MSISIETLNKLARFDTATICNAIELFEVRPRDQGYMNATIHCCFPELRPMVGFAATAAFRASGLPITGNAYGRVADQIKQFESLPGPAVVVFQDLDSPTVGATFGEMMCRTYQSFGSTGLITSGGARDLDQVQPLALSRVQQLGDLFTWLLPFDEYRRPTHVGGLYIQQGDLIHGDRNGVCTIPLDIATEVADVAAEFGVVERMLIEFTEREDEKRHDDLVSIIKEMDLEFKEIRTRVSRKR